MGADDVTVAKYRVAGKGESWSAVSQQQYGQLALVLKDAFRRLLNVPKNVIVVAQERTFGGKEEGGLADPELIRPTVGAALTPSVTGWLNPACDYVIQTFKRGKMTAYTKTLNEGKPNEKVITTHRREGGVEYCLRTEPHETFMTKFRSAGGKPLPDCIVLGTSTEGIAGSGYEKFMAVVRGEHG